MINTLSRKRHSLLFKALNLFVAVNFAFSLILPGPLYAQTIMSLPALGTMVPLSPVFVPVMLRGIKVFANEPFRFDFLVDTGNTGLQGEQLKEESTKLVKYFLASLTMPEDDLWVNLSPYEKNKIIPDEFGLTEMGRDLLAQDYILKQLTASLIYPEDDLGKKFWERVYKKAQEQYGTTEIPINTFNKVWIVPDKAVVNEVGNVAFVAESHLKVMMEEDYLALQQSQSLPAGRQVTGHKSQVKSFGSEVSSLTSKRINNLSSEIIREIILPEIEKEVNTGKNFAQLRQIYNSLILAAWYKRGLKESILTKIYVDQKKVDGVDVDDKEVKQKIYERYLEAYKKGVYNFIKEEYDSAKQEMIPRKYFSGGMRMSLTHMTTDGLQINTTSGDQAMLGLSKVVVGSTFSVGMLFADSQRSSLAQMSSTPDAAMMGAGLPEGITPDELRKKLSRYLLELLKMALDEAKHNRTVQLIAATVLNDPKFLRKAYDEHSHEEWITIIAERIDKFDVKKAQQIIWEAYGKAHGGMIGETITIDYYREFMETLSALVSRIKEKDEGIQELSTRDLRFGEGYMISTQGFTFFLHPAKSGMIVSISTRELKSIPIHIIYRKPGGGEGRHTGFVLKEGEEMSFGYHPEGMIALKVGSRAFILEDETLETTVFRESTYAAAMIKKEIRIGHTPDTISVETYHEATTKTEVERVYHDIIADFELTRFQNYRIPFVAPIKFEIQGFSLLLGQWENNYVLIGPNYKVMSFVRNGGGLELKGEQMKAFGVSPSEAAKFSGVHLSFVGQGNFVFVNDFSEHHGTRVHVYPVVQRREAIVENNFENLIHLLGVEDLKAGIVKIRYILLTGTIISLAQVKPSEKKVVVPNDHILFLEVDEDLKFRLTEKHFHPNIEEAVIKYNEVKGREKEDRAMMGDQELAVTYRPGPLFISGLKTIADINLAHKAPQGVVQEELDMWRAKVAEALAEIEKQPAMGKLIIDEQGRPKAEFNEKALRAYAFLMWIYMSFNVRNRLHYNQSYGNYQAIYEELVSRGLLHLWVKFVLKEFINNENIPDLKARTADLLARYATDLREPEFLEGTSEPSPFLELSGFDEVQAKKYYEDFILNDSSPLPIDIRQTIKDSAERQLEGRGFTEQNIEETIKSLSERGKHAFQVPIMINKLHLGQANDRAFAALQLGDPRLYQEADGSLRQLDLDLGVTALMQASKGNDINLRPQANDSIAGFLKAGFSIVRRSEQSKGPEFEAQVRGPIDMEAWQRHHMGDDTEDQAMMSAESAPIGGGSLPEAIFRVPSNDLARSELSELKSILDKAFGSWTDEKAKKEAERISREFKRIIEETFEESFEGSTGSTEDLLKILLVSEKKYNEFVTILKTIEKSSDKAEIRRFMNIFFQDTISPGAMINVKSWTALSDKSGWINRFENLRQEYRRLTQWDFVNRFNGAEGVVLWRFPAEYYGKEEKFFSLKRGDRLRVDGLFFTQIPHYAVSFAKYVGKDMPLVLMYVPVSSIKITSWLDRQSRDEGYEPEVIVSGDVEFIDMLFLDSPADLKTLEPLQKGYEEALRTLPQVDERDLMWLERKLTDPDQGNALQVEYFDKREAKGDKDTAMMSDKDLATTYVPGAIYRMGLETIAEIYLAHTPPGGVVQDEHDMWRAKVAEALEEIKIENNPAMAKLVIDEQGRPKAEFNEKALRAYTLLIWIEMSFAGRGRNFNDSYRLYKDMYTKLMERTLLHLWIKFLLKDFINKENVPGLSVQTADLIARYATDLREPDSLEGTEEPSPLPELEGFEKDKALQVYDDFINKDTSPLPSEFRRAIHEAAERRQPTGVGFTHQNIIKVMEELSTRGEQAFQVPIMISVLHLGQAKMQIFAALQLGDPYLYQEPDGSFRQLDLDLGVTALMQASKGDDIDLMMEADSAVQGLLEAGISIVRRDREKPGPEFEAKVEGQLDREAWQRYKEIQNNIEDLQSDDVADRYKGAAFLSSEKNYKRLDGKFNVSLLERTREAVQRVQKGASQEVVQGIAGNVLDNLDKFIKRARKDLGKGGSKDKAMLSAPQTPGGIDLNPADLNLQINRDQNGVPLPIEQQPIQNINIQGLVPIIINIAPISDLPLFLGNTPTEITPVLSLSKNAHH